MTQRMMWAAAIVVAVGILYILGYRAVQPIGTDTGQIRGAVVDSVDALRHGRAGDAMRIVAPDYKDSTGMNTSRLRLLARQAARNRDAWTASVLSVESQIAGDTARVAVTVTVGDTGGNSAPPDTIELRMRKDRVYAWLIFPTDRWRVISADHLPSDALLLGG